MNKAVFIDRDGVINNDSGHYYISDPNDFVLNEGIIELLSWLKSHDYLLILISNQGGISRGFYTKEDTENVHLKMAGLLSAHGIFFTEIYYCPHHPDNENCICRKPGTLMIEKAVARFSVDISRSFFIGDRDLDVKTGENAGLEAIKVETNQNMSLIIPIIKEKAGIS